MEDSRFRVLHLYERVTSRADGAEETVTYELAGFMTLFLFSNPVRVHNPLSLRVCQALILPPYQRCGHGFQLMSVAYNIAHKMDVYDITVEDPCEGFVALRDVMDWKVCADLDLFKEVWSDVAWKPHDGYWIDAQKVNSSSI